MFCPNCGAMIPDHASFCGSCGTRLGGGLAASASRVDKVQPSTPQAQVPPQAAQAQVPPQPVQTQVPQQPTQIPPAQPFAQNMPAPQLGQMPLMQQPTQAQLAEQQVQRPLPAQPPAQIWGGASQQWSPAAEPELGGGPRRIMDDRNILKILLLVIVTCGIYSYVYVYQMAQDMNTMCEDDDQSTGGLLSYILLSIVTCGLYGIVWEYKIANRIVDNAPAYGFEVRETGDTLLLWRLIGVATCGLGAIYGEQVLCENMNRLAKAYNRKHGFA